MHCGFALTCHTREKLGIRCLGPYALYYVNVRREQSNVSSTRRDTSFLDRVGSPCSNHVWTSPRDVADFPISSRNDVGIDWMSRTCVRVDRLPKGVPHRTYVACGLRHSSAICVSDH